MYLQSGTKYYPNGNVQYKQSFNVFSVKDMGKGVARGQLSAGRKPYGAKDQALIDAGYKLDQKGYIHGNIFVAFSHNAYQKALSLKNGAIIDDVIFDIDIYPYVNNEGQIIYNNLQWMITDFNIKNGDAATTTASEPETPIAPAVDNPFTANDTRSPMYTQQNQPAPAANENYSEY